MDLESPEEEPLLNERHRGGASPGVALGDSQDHSRDTGWLELSERRTRPRPGRVRLATLSLGAPLTMALAQQLRAER